MVARSMLRPRSRLLPCLNHLQHRQKEETVATLREKPFQVQQFIEVVSKTFGQVEETAK